MYHNLYNSLYMEKETVNNIVKALKRLIYKLKNGYCECLTDEQIKSLMQGFRNILQVEKAAMKFSMPKGKESITSDRSYIYIKEQNNIETLLGIITHYHVRDFALMYDEL